MKNRRGFLFMTINANDWLSQAYQQNKLKKQMRRELANLRILSFVNCIALFIASVYLSLDQLIIFRHDLFE